MRNLSGKATKGLASFTASALLTASLAVAGQARPFGSAMPKWKFGLTFGGGLPSGAFWDNIGHPGFSIDLSLGHRLGNSPLTLGVDCSFVIYGHTSRTDFISSTVPLEVDVDTENDIIQGLLYLKLQPVRGRVRPYVEALAGINYLFTDTTIAGTDYPYDEISSSTNFDDLALTAGFGAGLGIRLGRQRPQIVDGSKGTQVLLDVKVRYLAGGRAKYLREDSIIPENGSFTYDYRESTTNLISAQAGLSILF